MNSSVSRPDRSSLGALPLGREMTVPVLLVAACFVAQLYLVLFKSFNWDEFLHYGQVYQLKAGTLSQPFQVLHSRILSWAPYVADNLIDEMRAARLFIWSVSLLTLAAIYGLALNFTTARNAFFAAFAYLSAGYVFTHAFSIRADPLVTAALMGALFLMARNSLTVLKAIAIGALVGLAGMITLKAVFYAPCFAGLAWLKSREASNKARYLAGLVVIVVAAIATFAAIFLYHTADLAGASGGQPARTASGAWSFRRWLTAGIPFAGYTVREIVLSPLFFFCLLLAPIAWRKIGLKLEAKLALAGLIAPLVVLLFYRNTFPYFFVFILAPAAVAIAPALGRLCERYGYAFMSIVLAAIPLALTVLEPREVIGRQRALIDYVHREYPPGTRYLDYSGMIADYPRIIKYLTSGNGIENYHRRGVPVVANEIDGGRLPFIIANQEVISSALERRPIAGTLLPADLAAMAGNYVQQWGPLWREGKLIPAGPTEFEFELRRPGEFVLDGDSVIIDGVQVTKGTRIDLDRGTHVVSGKRELPVILWRGKRLPATPPDVDMTKVFTTF